MFVLSRLRAHGRARLASVPLASPWLGSQSIPPYPFHELPTFIIPLGPLPSPEMIISPWVASLWGEGIRLLLYLDFEILADVL